MEAALRAERGAAKVALVSSEPIRPRMAGVGLRYVEFARRLAAEGLDVLLVSPADPEEMAQSVAQDAVACARFDPARLAGLLSERSCVVAQGQLANDVLLAAPEMPAAIDLYDPWLVENLHYAASLGLDPFRNDHATWLLQMARGDFFLCSCEEQRLFYLGFLTALGRVNPPAVAEDPALERLIAAVPFGIPEEVPEHRPYLPPRRPGEARILFGALYDWYDPWTLLGALERLETPWRLLFIRHPNPDLTPQRLFTEVEAWCRRRGWWGERVEGVEWVPAERRYDLLRDVDLLATSHRPGLETSLALRTRYLDALAAGCPVLISAGGALARLLAESGAGWVVPAPTVQATAETLRQALAANTERAVRVEAGRRLAAQFAWPRVIEPLLRFCRAPRRDPHKASFGAALATAAPPDDRVFRLRRKLRRWWQPGLPS